MRYFLSAFILFASGSVNAQIMFQKTFEGASNASGWHAEQTNDSGYVVCGVANAAGPGGSTFLIMKTDANGDTLWTKMFGGTGGEDALCVTQTNDGGYIASGYTYSFGSGNSDAYLVRTDNAGNLLWSKVYGGIYAEDILTVQETADNGFILLGSTASFGSGPTAFDVYLIRTNATGDTLWTKTFGGAGSDYGLSLQITSDGGYIITGYTSGFGVGQDDVYLIRTDVNGNLLWSKTYGGPDSDVAWSVKQTTDGGYIVAGTTHSSGTNNSGDIYLIRTDGNGDTLWTKAFGGTLATEQGYSVQQTSDGGFIVLGETYSFGAGHSDLYLIKTDSIGNLLWSSTFGGSQFEHGYSVQQTADDGYIIGANTNSFGAPGVYLVKTNSNGTSGCNESNPATIIMASPTQITIPATLVSSGSIVSSPATLIKTGLTVNSLCDNVGINEINSENSFLLYPNPTNGDATLEFYNPKNENCMLTLYDCFGRLVWTTPNIETGKVKIERQNFTDGIYFFRVEAEGKIISSGKLILQ